MTPGRAHLSAVFVALFVTALWSSSWVLIKWGLVDIAPLPFAGLRYALAALLLSPIILTPANRRALVGCGRREWGLLIGFGLLQYGVTQAAQFLALSYLPATTLSLMLTFTPALVAVLGAVLLGERIGWREILGIAVFLGGAGLYFESKALPVGASLGLIIGTVGVLANAGQTLLGRKVNRDPGLPPSLITALSMAAGAAALLTTGIAVQGWPEITLPGWLIVGWLAVANTALAFWLWNRAQAVLSALEASLINNTMLIQIAVLAVLFLGERLTATQVAGLTLAGVGVLYVQLARMRAARSLLDKLKT
ncbi:DMT family transporter [Brevundimonas sp.]|uniref:DMT family transporter n=1 Tax=Brevundimonas sp. TaxID=1871086 RepID=UPI002731275B|nr:DMT family transporter [Brevundimonas sp.]